MIKHIVFWNFADQAEGADKSANLATAAEQRIENRTAVFAALDKVTARISKLEAKLGETVRFGALKITPRACYSRPPTEAPKTSTFVEIDEVLLDGNKEAEGKAYWDLGATAHSGDHKLLAYATGVPASTADRPAIEAIVDAVRDQGYGFRSLVHEVVQSEVFRNK